MALNGAIAIDAGAPRERRRRVAMQRRQDRQRVGVGPRLDGVDIRMADAVGAGDHVERREQVAGCRVNAKGIARNKGALQIGRKGAGAEQFIGRPR